VAISAQRPKLHDRITFTQVSRADAAHVKRPSDWKMKAN